MPADQNQIIAELFAQASRAMEELMFHPPPAPNPYTSHVTFNFPSGAGM